MQCGSSGLTPGLPFSNDLAWKLKESMTRPVGSRASFWAPNLGTPGLIWLVCCPCSEGEEFPLRPWMCHLKQECAVPWPSLAEQTRKGPGVLANLTSWICTPEPREEGKNAASLSTSLLSWHHWALP